MPGPSNDKYKPADLSEPIILTRYDVAFDNASMADVIYSTSVLSTMAKVCGPTWLQQRQIERIDERAGGRNLLDRDGVLPSQLTNFVVRTGDVQLPIVSGTYYEIQWRGQTYRSDTYEDMYPERFVMLESFRITDRV